MLSCCFFISVFKTENSLFLFRQIKCFVFPFWGGEPRFTFFCLSLFFRRSCHIDKRGNIPGLHSAYYVVTPLSGEHFLTFLHFLAASQPWTVPPVCLQRRGIIEICYEICNCLQRVSRLLPNEIMNTTAGGPEISDEFSPCVSRL